MQPSNFFKRSWKKIATGAIIIASTTPAFADDVNLSKAVPDHLLGSWFMDAAVLAIGAVAAVKGIQLIMRFVRRV